MQVAGIAFSHGMRMDLEWRPTRYDTQRHELRIPLIVSLV